MILELFAVSQRHFGQQTNILNYSIAPFLLYPAYSAVALTLRLIFCAQSQLAAAFLDPCGFYSAYEPHQWSDTGEHGIR